MTARVTLAAHAKLNLHLQVLAREDTGYHQLETVFQRLALADAVTVTVTPGAGVSLTCTPDVGVPAEQNLGARAAMLYAQHSPWAATQHIAIDIEKHIPHGGGLGGGSADAGAVLRALQQLSPEPLSSKTLMTIAGMLGADVPFMTITAPLALAWGRGDRLLPLPPLPRRDVLLAIADVGVPTPDAYRWLADARTAGAIAPASATAHTPAQWQDWAWIDAHTRNDFESVVYAARPDLAQTSDVLRHSGAPLVRLCGSGATIAAFGIAACDALGHTVRTHTLDALAA
jgi:4-diphosphocytidyl-2-C-methyl-D-erythritol kinase